MSRHNLPIQLNSENNIIHCLEIQTLPLSVIEALIAEAAQFLKKYPDNLLKKITVANLFFEPSTRTLTSFSLAARKLGATAIDLNIPSSSTSKGESLIDTLRTLAALECQYFIVRHSDNGAVTKIAETIGNHVAIINAGDGSHAHPSQALLDLFTIKEHFNRFDNLSVSIVGDVLHSRVAKSLLAGLKTVGIKKIRVVGPKNLLPKTFADENITVYHELEAGIKEADVVYLLRLQKERMQDGLVPSFDAYFNKFGVTGERLKYAKPNAVVMHPGPINRGVELDDVVADGRQSLILKQVKNGLYMRMAIMSKIAQHRADIPTCR